MERKRQMNRLRTVSEDDKYESFGLPFWEKPAIIPIEMDSEGKLRQAPPRD